MSNGTTQTRSRWLDFVVIVLVVIISILYLGPKIFKSRPKSSATVICQRRQQTPEPRVNQDSINQILEMIKLGWYPVNVINSWPDSAMAIFPQGVSIEDTVRFVTSGEENLVFCRPGRHGVKEVFFDRLAKSGQDKWVVIDDRFTVAKQPIYNHFITGEPCHGAIYLTVVGTYRKKDPS